MPKVLLPIGDASKDLDTLYLFFRLPEEDFEIIAYRILAEIRWQSSRSPTIIVGNLPSLLSRRCCSMSDGEYPCTIVPSS